MNYHKEKMQEFKDWDFCWKVSDNGFGNVLTAMVVNQKTKIRQSYLQSIQNKKQIEQMITYAKDVLTDWLKTRTASGNGEKEETK